MIAYDRLSQIIPADIALANKALQVALQQVSGISNLNLPTFGNTVANIQTTASSLPILNQQTTPIAGDTRAYYLNVLGAYGTGVCNTILIVDMLGTAMGVVNSQALANSTALLGTMNTSYLQSCYQTMLNLINGDYTTVIPGTPPDPDTYQIDIPGGTPGAGSYGPYNTTTDAYNDVMTTVLIPLTQSTISTVASTYPAQTAQLNINFDAICQQMGNEQDLQVRAGLNFADFFGNLQANSQSSTMTFIFSLPGYGQDTIQGGAAQFIQSVADYNVINGTLTVNSPVITNVPAWPGVVNGITISGANIPSGTTVSSFSYGANTITMSQNANASISNTNVIAGNVGGQAIIGVMIQGRNQTALNNAGILTNTNVPLTYPIQPTQANLVV